MRCLYCSMSLGNSEGQGFHSSNIVTPRPDWTAGWARELMVVYSMCTMRSFLSSRRAYLRGNEGNALLVLEAS